MASTDTPISCGVRELYDLHNNPRDLILELLHENYDDYGDPEFPFSQVIFSDKLTEGGKPVRYCDGERLAQYIRENGLGHLIESRPIKNRNTGNRIKTWVWNITNIRKLKKAVGWKKREDDDEYVDEYGW